MLLTNIEWGNVADWVSALATFLATGLALTLSLKKPKELEISVVNHFLFPISEYRIQHKRLIVNCPFTVGLLRCMFLNLTTHPIYVKELSIKYGFRKKIVLKIANQDATFEIPSNNNIIDDIYDFNNNNSITLHKFVFNPFGKKAQINGRICITDYSGNHYKSKKIKFK